MPGQQSLPFWQHSGIPVARIFALSATWWHATEAGPHNSTVRLTILSPTLKSVVARMWGSTNGGRGSSLCSGVAGPPEFQSRCGLSKKDHGDTHRGAAIGEGRPEGKPLNANGHRQCDRAFHLTVVMHAECRTPRAPL